MSPEVLCLNSVIEGLPREIQIIPFGHHETEKGPFILDEEGMAAVMEDFNARVNDMVIDYEHQSLSGGEAPAAGWIKRLFSVTPSSPTESRGERGGLAPGIWASVQWTERARRYLGNGEYRYLSPVFLKRLSDGRVVRLLNAALTNQPAIDGMAPVVNRAQPGTTNRARPGATSREGSGATGKSKNIVKEEKVMKRLLMMLGLPDTAEEADAVEKLEALKAETATLKADINEVYGLLGLEGSAALSEVKGTVIALKQAASQVEALREKVAALEAELMRRGAEEVVADAMKGGKITPAQRDWAFEYAVRDPEGFRVFAAKAARVIHTGEVAGGTPPGGMSYWQAGDIQRQVNKALGISEEIFRKHNKVKGA
jgi:phage I-like protein